MAELRRQPYMPPSLSSLAAAGKSHREAIKYILDSGEGYKCGTDFVFTAEVWSEITAFIRAALLAKGELLVGELRDRFDFSRKYVIPILEETDRIRLTRRDGDKRVKGERFESDNPSI